MQLHRIATKDLIRTRRDAVFRTFHHLDAEGRVKGAAEVVGDRKRVVIDARFVQDDVAVIRIKVLVDDARARPERAVCIETDGRREGGHARNERRIEIQAPLKNVPVVNGEVVDHREGPGTIQRTSHEITEVAF